MNDFKDTVRVRPAQNRATMRLSEYRLGGGCKIFPRSLEEILAPRRDVRAFPRLLAAVMPDTEVGRMVLAAEHGLEPGGIGELAEAGNGALIAVH